MAQPAIVFTWRQSEVETTRRRGDEQFDIAEKSHFYAFLLQWLIWTLIAGAGLDLTLATRVLDRTNM